MEFHYIVFPLMGSMVVVRSRELIVKLCQNRVVPLLSVDEVSLCCALPLPVIPAYAGIHSALASPSQARGFLLEFIPHSMRDRNDILPERLIDTMGEDHRKLG